MEDKKQKQSMTEMDELHDSILSLCSDQKDDNCENDEPDGDFINSLIEYTPEVTIQNFEMSSHESDKIEYESAFETSKNDETICTSRVEVSQNDLKDETICNTSCEVYQTDETISNSVYEIAQDNETVHKTEFNISSIPSSPEPQGCSSDKPLLKPSEPDTSKLLSDSLNVSVVSKSPVKLNSIYPAPWSKQALSHSTPLTSAFKRNFKTSIRAQSTPINPISQKSNPLNIKTKINLFKDDNVDLGVISEEEMDDPSVTFEDLLADLTHLIGDEKENDMPAKLKSEDLHRLSNINQENQISRIDLDSILLEGRNMRNDELNGSNSSISSNTSCSKPGRFSTLNATVRTTVIEEMNENEEDVEDILGLDDYIISGMIEDDDDELSSDEEKTLLFDDSALCKTVIKSKSKDLEISSDQLKMKDEESKFHPAVAKVIDDNLDKNLEIRKDDVVDTDAKKLKDIDSQKSEEDSESHMLKRDDDKVLAKVILSRDDKAKVTCKVSPVKADISNTTTADNRASLVLSENKIEIKPVSSQDTEIKLKTVESKTVTPPNIEQEFVQNENALMKEVMKRWNSKGIPKPDTNLTYASWARQHWNILMGQLEGHHLTTLSRSNINVKAENDQGPPAKKQKTGSVMPMPNMKANLEAQIEELAFIEKRNADEIYRERESVITGLKEEEFFQSRTLLVQQDAERRQLFAQRQACLINDVFYKVQLMQLMQEHEYQKNRMKCHFRDKIENRYLYYFQKVSERNKQYSQRKDQLNCLLKQLSQQPNLDHGESPHGPHVTVDLVKGPCATNNQTYSVVTVCLPADIAAAIIREDEVYDMFYTHPKLTKKDYYVKKK